ncbi:M23 family metallopeptidase [Streptomyces sp. NPDC051018]|uniref:M23 family metallopeptidase n=1 Tax=Streptomyces sp. NPDC051018 TaxID=3365639 RepID=UPI0037B6F9C9
MGSRHRDRLLLLVPVVLLCVLLTPFGATASDGPSHGPVLDPGTEVARLYEEAAEATAEYERNRRAADTQLAGADRLQRRLGERRRELASVRETVGAVARAQYRSGGRLLFAARLLMSRNPDELMRGRRFARQAETALSRLISRSRAAERRLAVAEGRARAAWHDFDTRKQRLATVKQRIETRLEEVKWALQGQADSSVASGTCAGAVRRGGHGPGVPPGTAWVTPVERYGLSAGFGSGGARWARRHTGQDFAVDIGTPVRSVGAGRVRSVSCRGAFGIEIIVAHPGGYYTQYAHLASVAVDQGERVRPGQRIGQAGTTGNSTGPHLHFEVRLTPYLGSGVDPAEWFRERGVRLEPAPAG